MKHGLPKICAIILILYSIITGLLLPVPQKPVLYHTIRNLYFHVPMWFSMFILFLISVVYSIKYLHKQKINYDIIAVESAKTGLLFGVLGLLTGILWAKYTWGQWWSSDPKQNNAAIAMLVYLAYTVLRNGLKQEETRAKISAVYNIFSFPIMIMLLFVLPRLTDSLHPGGGGNPAFNNSDLDKRMRMVFYPACMGWIIMACWIANIRYRIRKINRDLIYN